jgi:nitrite reductase/ring-hydroxylating ferredoxin subunit
MKVPLIAVDEIPDEGTRVVDFFGRSVHVYKKNGQPRAVANVCMHFGGPLEAQEDRLVCPWHGAEYSLQNGERLIGPAPRNSHLMFLSTVVEDGMLTYVWSE